MLKFFCICFCLFSLLLLTPAFRSARPASHLVDFVCLLNAIMSALGFYGIYRRAQLAWQLGWFVGSLLLSEWLVLCLAPILRHAKPNAWIAAVVFAIAGFAVALYWGYWWKRQNNFFPYLSGGHMGTRRRPRWQVRTAWVIVRPASDREAAHRVGGEDGS